MTKLAAALLLTIAACNRTTTPAAAPEAPTRAPDALRIQLTKVYVDDQDKALRFYTDVLGFSKHTDESNGGFRWLTVSADPDGTELLLEVADPAAATFQESLFKAGTPAAMFFTDDVDAAYARIQKLGAEFTLPPTDVTFAKIAIVDDTCGNLVQITQLY